jgi:tetratricopeptide (TPR) repeat protein
VPTNEGAASRFHLENASLLFDFAQMEEAQLESDLALDLAFKEGSPSSYVEALSMRGRSKIARGLLEEAYIDLQEAYNAAKKLTDLSLLPQIEDAIGIYYRDIGHLDQAIEYFERSLNACYGPPVRSIQGIGTVSANLARTYLYRNSQNGTDLSKAESILRKSITTLQVHPNSDFHGQIPVWQLLALVFIQNGDLENASECLAYELSLKHSSPKQGSTVPVPVLDPTVAKRPVAALLPILDYLKEELTGSMQAQDVHSQISIHFFTAKVHSELVRRLKLNGQNSDVVSWHIEKAYSLYKDGIDILEQKLRGRLAAIENRITFIQYRIDAYQDVALTCLNLSPETHPHRGRDAFFYVERSRSRTFLDLLASSGFQTSINNEIISVPESYTGIQSCL